MPHADAEMGKLSEKVPLLGFKSKRKQKQLEKFYAAQQDLQKKFLEDAQLLEAIGNPEAEGGFNVESSKAKLRRYDRILAQITVVINVILLLGKMVVAYLSGSLSILSSVVDSAVDIASGLIIWLTTKAMDKHDPYLYPRGRSKLEPLAVILTAVIMAVTNLTIIIKSIESIAENKVNPIVEWPTIGTMLAVIVVKAILMIICWRQGTVSAKVLMIDHRNDCESNAMAIACAFIGSRYWKWIDPIGAILICTYIIVQWFIAGREQIPLLSGKRASPEYINRIIKLCIDHDPRIKQLETVCVYHYGSKFLTEVHIVLDEQMPLKLAHDISEELQMKLEHLPYVERAFIHCDYVANARMCSCGQKH